MCTWGLSSATVICCTTILDHLIPPDVNQVILTRNAKTAVLFSAVVESSVKTVGIACLQLGLVYPVRVKLTDALRTPPMGNFLIVGPWVSPFYSALKAFVFQHYRSHHNASLRGALFTGTRKSRTFEPLSKRIRDRHSDKRKRAGHTANRFQTTEQLCSAGRKDCSPLSKRPVFSWTSLPPGECPTTTIAHYQIPALKATLMFVFVLGWLRNKG
jgi:hypothetical protein